MFEVFESSIYQKNKNFPWQSFDSETIIVDPSSHQSFELNELGTFVWNRIDGKTKVAELLKAIGEEYEVESRELSEDMLEWFIEMGEAGLILDVS